LQGHSGLQFVGAGAGAAATSDPIAATALLAPPKEGLLGNVTSPAYLPDLHTRDIGFSQNADNLFLVETLLHLPVVPR